MLANALAGAHVGVHQRMAVDQLQSSYSCLGGNSFEEA
jgi:hypothetical protein